MPIGDIEKIIRKEPIDNFYDVGTELGRGKFAIVKRCTQKSTGTQFAAKVLKKRRHGRSVRADILVEIDIMQQANGSGKQPRIIKIFEVFESSHEFHIVLELATGGELFRVIAIEPLMEERAREVVYQILDGVQHLHTLNIVHLDLKPENILLSRKGSLDIKIADFGLSVQVREGQEMKNLVGTAEYVSPEILNFEPLSTYTDMWSIGALTYALMTGYSPFQGETHQETFLNVSMVDYDFDDEVFENVSSEAKDFIEKLLKLQPRKRLTAAACLQHPWMKARTNLNSSTSSLDSAVCVDSTEASPVSSASSSFGPAPSATTSTANTTSLSPLSKPEEFSQHLSTEISSLATERIMADTKKQQPEDSPTSTASSTSTLREGSPTENLPGLKEPEAKEPLNDYKRSLSPAKLDETDSKSTASKYLTEYDSKKRASSSLEGHYKSRYERSGIDASPRYASCSPSTSFEIRRSSRTTSMETRGEAREVVSSKEKSVSPTFKHRPEEKSAKTAVSASTTDPTVKITMSESKPDVVTETSTSGLKQEPHSRSSLEQEPPSNKVPESDTDYGSGSSRSSSLETTPTTKPTTIADKVASGSRNRSRVSESYAFKSSTLDRASHLSRERPSRQMSDGSTSSKTHRTTPETTPLTYSSGSATLDRKHKSTVADIDSLNPNTLASLEKFERLKKRPVTPEPVSPKVSESKLLQSPERHLRRKSEGNKPIGHIISQMGRPVESVEKIEETEEILAESTENQDDVKSEQDSVSTESKARVEVSNEVVASEKKQSAVQSESAEIEHSPQLAPSSKPETSQSNTESVKDSKPKDPERNHIAREKDSLTKTIQPVKSVSPTNGGKYRSSTDNVYTMAGRTPVESAWRSFRSEKSAVRTNKTREDDSWLIRSTNSRDERRTGSRAGLKSWESSPNNSRSNTPTSPLCKTSDGSRSATPTSPSGTISPRQPVITNKSGTNSPTPLAVVTSPTEKEKPTSSITKTVIITKPKSPTPPVEPDPTKNLLSTSPGRDIRRPKAFDSDKLRARKIEARKTPVLTPEQLEQLDMLIKGGDLSGDLLETCPEEDEELSVKKEVSKIQPTSSVADTSSRDVEDSVATSSAVERRVSEKRLKDRSKSLVVTEVRGTVFPEEGGSPVDAFSQSLNMRTPGIDRKSRFRQSLPVGLSSSLSMTDLSQIGKRENKARRVGRSNSKRLVGKSAIDSYVTDTRTSPSHRSTSGSLLVTNLHKSTKTLPAKTLSGKSIDHKEKKSETRRFRLFK